MFTKRDVVKKKKKKEQMNLNGTPKEDPEMRNRQKMRGNKPRKNKQQIVKWQT